MPRRSSTRRRQSSKRAGARSSLRAGARSPGRAFLSRLSLPGYRVFRLFNKYWAVRMNDARSGEICTAYNRLGRPPRLFCRRGSAQERQNLIQQKLRKGYREV